MPHHPFRPTQTPSASGRASSPSGPSRFAPPPGPPPPVPSAESRPADVPHTSPPEVTVSNDTVPDPEPEEPPPPYTMTPQRWAGEETVQYGPRRPFDPAPAPLRPIPPQTSLSPSPSSSRPHSAGGHRPSSSVGSLGAPSSGGGPLSPPPRHPSVRPPESGPGRRRNSGSFVSGWNTPTPLSVPGDYPSTAGPPPQSSSLSPPSNPNLSRRASESGRYQPPSGPPPSSSNSHSTAHDGKPTRSPVAGHPLMLHGNVLVYPPRYTCHKCYNIGFKELDVNHPCRKCWERYGRPYEGPLQYADWTDITTNFQRPLPQGIRIPNNETRRSRDLASPQDSNHVASSPIQVGGAPPPGAMVVRPGDPRIGGRLCWNCGGSGLVPILFFGEDTCDVCRGVGRTF